MNRKTWTTIAVSALLVLTFSMVNTFRHARAQSVNGSGPVCLNPFSATPCSDMLIDVGGKAAITGTALLVSGSSAPTVTKILAAGALGAQTAVPFHTVPWSCTLGTNCAAMPFDFTSVTGLTCSGSDQTAAAAIKIVYGDGGNITATGTGTDALSGTCTGPT